MGHRLMVREVSWHMPSSPDRALVEMCTSMTRRSGQQMARVRKEGQLQQFLFTDSSKGLKPIHITDTMKIWKFILTLQVSYTLKTLNEGFLLHEYILKMFCVLKWHNTWWVMIPMHLLKAVTSSLWRCMSSDTLSAFNIHQIQEPSCNFGLHTVSQLSFQDVKCIQEMYGMVWYVHEYAN